LTLNGPAPTDIQFDTVEINQQYDGLADFPLYPLATGTQRATLTGTATEPIR
jgi:PE-PPE domain